MTGTRREIRLQRNEDFGGTIFLCQINDVLVVFFGYDRFLNQIEKSESDHGIRICWIAIHHILTMSLSYVEQLTFAVSSSCWKRSVIINMHIKGEIWQL
jgi:preprotein translocase subunit SecA